MFGQILVNFLFASAIVSCGAYFLSWRDNDVMRKVGRSFMLVVFGGLCVVLGMLVYNIFQHDFSYYYVYNYSNTELSAPLLFATSYAGQEGSFMLWTFLVSLIGVCMLPYVRRVGYESHFMSFYTLALIFLLLMMVAKSPFQFVWEHFASDPNVYTGFEPQNGRGLNPLLHNLWITIHPPILFTGFAAMTVPFAFAMAGLARREYTQWIRVSLPWTLFGTAVLGFGIMLGGFWAYETLGWGGFWAWDPVENSSLIPWLVCVALVHTMLTQKQTGGLVKTNFFLAVSAFILVLYSTFLTRSGVLGDTSVHSFVDPGMFAYILLIGTMIVFGVLGFGMIFRRIGELGKGAADFKLNSREFIIGIGSMLTLISAGIVLFGTSYPLFSELIVHTKVAMQVSFYNTSHLLLAILIGVVNAVSMLVNWKVTGKALFFKRLRLPLIMAIAATALVVAFGWQDIPYVLLAFASFLSLFVNLDLLIRLIASRPDKIGAYVSHIGIAALFLGVIATSRYSVLDHARLVQDEPTEVLGMTLTYQGKREIDKQFKDREKYEYLVKVQKNGGEGVVKPILYWSDYNQRKSAFLEPGINRTFVQDVYVSPKAVEIQGSSPTAAVHKFEETPFPFDSNVVVTLQRFDMTSAMQGGGPDLRMGVELTFDTPDSTWSEVIYSTRTVDNLWRYEPYQVPGTGYYVALREIKPDRSNLANSEAVLSFADIDRAETLEREVFSVEVSTKPFINLVWIGVILMVAGFGVAIVRRVKELEPRGKKPANPVGAAKPMPQVHDAPSFESESSGDESEAGKA